MRFCKEVSRRQGIEAKTLDLPCGQVRPCPETEWDVVCSACTATEGGLAFSDHAFLGVENLLGPFLLLMCLLLVTGRAGGPCTPRYVVEPKVI